MRTAYLRIDSSFQKVPSPNSKILGRAPQNTCHDLGLLSHLLQKWLHSFPALGNVGVTWHWAPRALMEHEGEESQPGAGQSTLPAPLNFCTCNLKVMVLGTQLTEQGCRDGL